MTLCTPKYNNPYFKNVEFKPTDINHGLWMEADNGIINNWLDNSPLRNNGTVTGASRYPIHTNNSIGSCYSFNGALSNNIKLATPVIGDSQTYTISMWIKTTSTSMMDVYGEGHDTSNTPLIIIRLNDTGIGSVKFGIRDNASVLGSIVYGAANINDGNWHHIVATQFNKSERYLYIDNVLRASGFVTNTLITTTNTYLGVLKRLLFSNYYTGQIGSISVNYVPFSNIDVNYNYTHSIYYYLKDNLYM